MNYNSVEQDRATVILHQMGAKVNSLHGIQTYVRFHLENNVDLYYVYHMTKDKEYYLQRIKPYAYGAGVFQSQDEIIQFIKNDFARFNNASKSSVFDLFITNSNKLNDLVQSIELLFLENNVPSDKMSEISMLLEDIDEKIVNLINTTPRL